VIFGNIVFFSYISNQFVFLFKSRRTSGNTEVIQSTPKQFERYENKTNTLVSCTCLIVLLTVSFIFGQIVIQWGEISLLFVLSGYVNFVFK